MKKKLLSMVMLIAFTATTLSAQSFGLRINEILYDPAGDLTGDANGDGVRDPNDDEFIELVNYSANTIDISGYKIYDSVITSGVATLKHTFAPNTTLDKGKAIVVFGGGTLTGNYQNAQAVLASSGGLSFQNSGEIIYITDAADNIVLRFDSDALSNNPDESYVRSPDFTGDFVQHNAPHGFLQTPGAKNDSTAFTGDIPADTLNITGEQDITTNQGTVQLTATMSPSFVTNTDHTWGTLDANIATVSTSGLVTAVSNGTVKIYADADAGAGTDTVTIQVSGQTSSSILELDQNFKMYPNPAQNFVQLETSIAVEQVEIINLSGKIVSVLRVENNQIDVSKLANGQYYIRITHLNKPYTQSFIKE